MLSRVTGTCPPAERAAPRGLPGGDVRWKPGTRAVPHVPHTCHAAGTVTVALLSERRQRPPRASPRSCWYLSGDRTHLAVTRAKQGPTRTPGAGGAGPRPDAHPRSRRCWPRTCGAPPCPKLERWAPGWLGRQEGGANHSLVQGPGRTGGLIHPEALVPTPPCRAGCEQQQQPVGREGQGGRGTDRWARP